MMRFIVSVLVGSLFAFIITIQFGCVTVPPPVPPKNCQELGQAAVEKLVADGYEPYHHQAGSDFVLIALKKGLSAVVFLVTSPARQAEAKEQSFVLLNKCVMPDNKPALFFRADLELKSQTATR